MKFRGKKWNDFDVENVQSNPPDTGPIPLDNEAKACPYLFLIYYGLEIFDILSNCNPNSNEEKRNNYIISIK